MSFFAIFLAFALEQSRPLLRNNWVHRMVMAWTQWIKLQLDAGQPVHGWITWAVAAVGPALLVAVVHWVLHPFSDVLMFAWTVLVLYLTLGFRQFSHHFTTIRQALEVGDEVTARSELAAWQEIDVSTLPRQELLRQVIEYAALAAHRHVFGVLLTYLLCAALGFGPAGAVLYRLAESLARRWSVHVPVEPEGAATGVAVLAWSWIDHVPARATGVAFAIVGNFEEAISAWRQEAPKFAKPNDGVILAATSGAINVRLGGQSLRAHAPAAGVAGSSGVHFEGREPQVAHLTSLVGLVWRSVVLWMLLLGLMTLARSVG